MIIWRGMGVLALVVAIALNVLVNESAQAQGLPFPKITNPISPTMCGWCVPVSDWALGIQVGECAGYRLQEDGLLIVIPHSNCENRHHRVSNLSQAGRYLWCCGALACRCRKAVRTWSKQ